MKDNNFSHSDFEILDSIRGIASTYVMIAHCRGVLWIGGNRFLQENPIETWSFADYLVLLSSLSTRLAVEFVIVFFVLSGFSIAYSLNKNKNILSFFKKRLVRIYPPYLAALVWAGLVFIITKELHPEFYEGKFITPTFDRYNQMNDYLALSKLFEKLLYMTTQGFTVPFWSLAHEVIFYLLAPLLLINRRFYYLISILLFVIYMILVVALNIITPQSIFIEFLGLYNFYFFLGIFLYYNLPKASSYLRKIGKRKSLLLVFFSLALIYAVNFIVKSESPWSYIPAGVFSCILIVCFLEFKIRINPLIKLGKHSYSLYITHFSSIFLFHSIYYLIVPKSNLPYITNYTVFWIAIPFCILVSYLFYLLIEKQTKFIILKIRASS